MVQATKHKPTVMLLLRDAKKSGQHKLPQFKIDYCVKLSSLSEWSIEDKKRDRLNEMKEILKILYKQIEA